MGKTPPKPVRPFSLDFSPLRKLRRYHELSGDDLARSVGVHRITLYRVERGLTTPSVTQVVAMARALGVPMHQLFTVIEGEPQ